MPEPVVLTAREGMHGIVVGYKLPDESSLTAQRCLVNKAVRTERMELQQFSGNPRPTD